MKKIIVFAGFCLSDYVLIARERFPSETHELICVYGREPNDSRTKHLLPLFDHSFHISEVPQNILSKIELVTCTQERDMATYIDFLYTLGWINGEQSRRWKRVIDKRLFKETMGRKHPQLVPKVKSFSNTKEFTDTLIYPFVIKPTNMTGSAFVSVIRNRKEFEVYQQKISAYGKMIKKLGKQPELVVEEFVAGPQYSLNVYIDSSGKIIFCPLIRVIPAFELGNDDTYSALQYNTDINGQNLNTLYESIKLIVETFHIKNTSAHFDCILTKTGWKICEVGLRIGGSRQTLYKLSHNFNHFLNDLNNRIGCQINLGKKQGTAVVIQKTSNLSGRLKSISYPQISSRYSFLIDKAKDIGDEIGPVGQGGVTALRVFLSGTDEHSTVEKSLYFYNHTDIDIL